jgi:hypothetical protein
VISIVLSIASEFASQILYFVKIRPKLSQANIKMSFDWLPHKRKIYLAEYKKIINGDKDELIWENVVKWLYYISWIFLVIAGLLTIFIM